MNSEFSMEKVHENEVGTFLNSNFKFFNFLSIMLKIKTNGLPADKRDLMTKSENLKVMHIF